MQITAAANRALDVMVVSLDEPGRRRISSAYVSARQSAQE
jgi:hypothetical protein